MLVDGCHVKWDGDLNKEKQYLFEISYTLSNLMIKFKYLKKTYIYSATAKVQLSCQN